MIIDCEICEIEEVESMAFYDNEEEKLLCAECCSGEEISNPNYLYCDEIRQCVVCGDLMHKGFVLISYAYFMHVCSVGCRQNIMTDKEYNESYDNGGECYYTEFEKGNV